MSYTAEELRRVLGAHEIIEKLAPRKARNFPHELRKQIEETINRNLATTDAIMEDAIGHLLTKNAPTPAIQSQPGAKIDRKGKGKEVWLPEGSNLQ